MKCVELIGKPEFELNDVYAFEGRLSQLYPNNRHVKQKIRQQLQVAARSWISRFRLTGVLSVTVAGLGGWSSFLLHIESLHMLNLHVRVTRKHLESTSS